MRNTIGEVILSRVIVRVISALLIAVILALFAAAGFANAQPLSDGKQAQLARQLLPSEGVPVDALPECGLDNSAQGQVGGWGFRDFVSSGSFVAGGGVLDPAPIRPLGVRLGEPCFDGGNLSVPARYSETPVPILDEDSDGQDDGADVASPTCDTLGVGSAVDQTEILSITTLCTVVVAACTSGASCPGGVGFSVADSFPLSVGLTDSNTRTLSLDTTLASTHAWTQGFTVQLWCQTAAGVLATVADDSFSATYSSTLPGSVSDALDCTGGTSSTRVPWAVVALSRTGGTVGSGDRVAGVVWSTAPLTPPAAEGERYYGGTQGARIAIPGLAPAGQPAGYVRCAENYAATSTFDFPVDGVAGDGVGPADNEPPVIVDGVATDWSVVQNNLVRAYPYVTPEDCPYLVAISMWVTTYQGDEESESGPVLVEWSADRYRGHYSYNDGDDELDLVCQIHPENAGCYDILNPPYVDGTDFDTVCAGAPAPEWLSFDWLPLWVGHFARCLFFPVNGFDRHGEVSSAWQASAGGQLADFATGFLSAFVVTGTCGLLLDGAEIRGTPIAIDTCSWGFATPMRTFLYWLIIVTGSLFWIGFTANTIIGLLNKRTPSPINMDHAS